MRRREFIALLGSCVAGWPLAARAQQQAMPVIGFLHSASPEPFASFVDAFRQGLSDTGYVEGKDVTIVYRWAEGRPDRLPALASDLVRRPVAVLVASGGSLSVLAAKAATSTIPIVFTGLDDPIKLGIVQSFNRPGGNATGVALFNAVLAAKRLELLRELIPKATTIGLLVNPANPNSGAQISDVEQGVGASGQKIQVFRATNEHDIDTAFATMVEQHVEALIIGADPFFQFRRDRLLELTARNAMPAIYFQREFPLAGGLISYGIPFPDAYRQAGGYTGRILKGAKPADLPVVQPTKFDSSSTSRPPRPSASPSRRSCSPA